MNPLKWVLMGAFNTVKFTAIALAIIVAVVMGVMFYGSPYLLIASIVEGFVPGIVFFSASTLALFGYIGYQVERGVW